ncbi:MAG: hypothetical protein RR564_05185 [Eubacterium sp.]
MKEKSSKKNFSKKQMNDRKHRHWVIGVTIGTFFSTMLITYISDTLLTHAGLIISFIILLFIIGFGVVADVVGVAVTAVNIEPFNAMAAKKIKGAKTSVFLVKNASRVSNLCNDVIGDICGIVSGATGVSIVIQLVNHYPLLETAIMSLVLSACVACLTVGGKALGKDLAMNNSTRIIHGISIPAAVIKIAVRGHE